MPKILLQRCIAVLIRATILFAAGTMVWWLLKPRQMSLEEVLFYVGAGPIILFSFGRFGDFVSRGYPTYQLSRSVMKPSAGHRAVADQTDLGQRERSGWPWILAGLLVWAGGYFLG